MIVVQLRGDRGAGKRVEVKGGTTAIHTSKTATLVQEEIIATVLEVSDKKGNVLASFNADDVQYFTEEDEVDER